MKGGPTDLLLIQLPNVREPSYLVGVASLKSYLQARGHRVTCFNPAGAALARNPARRTADWEDHFSLSAEEEAFTLRSSVLTPVIEELKEKIRSDSPRYLGFSLIHGNIRLSMECAREVKKEFPSLPILLGGPGTKIRRPAHYAQESADFLVDGDGEEVLDELLRQTDAEAGIAGLERRTDGHWKPTLSRPPARSLAGFPQPDYSDFEQDPCAANMFTSFPLSLGRGCPFRCRFCSVKNYGLQYRHYDLDACLEFVRRAVKKGQTNFFVHDPITNANPGWIRQFAKALVDEKLQINWGGSIRLVKYLSDTPTLDLLAESGFRTMITGLESASPRVLQHMKKFHEVEQIDRIFERVRDIRRKFPLQIFLQLIVGYPNETEEDFELTLDFVRRHRDVIDNIISCSSFLTIRSESDEISEMLAKGEFGLNVITDSNWASEHSSPSIRLDRMRRAAREFTELGLPHRMFYQEPLEKISPAEEARPLERRSGMAPPSSGEPENPFARPPL